MTRRQSYRSGAGFGLAGAVSISLTSLVSSVVVARVYGVHVIGEWALASAPVNAVWFLSSFRERPALVRELTQLEPRAPRVTGLFAAVFAASTALTIVVGALGLLAAYYVFRGPVGHPELFGLATGAMIGYVVITNSCFNLDTIFAGFRAGRALFWIRTHQAVAFLAISAVAGLIHPTAWALVLAVIGSYATSLVHRIVAVRSIMRLRVGRTELRDGFKTLPGIIRFGLKIAPGGIADGVANETGTWVLGIVGSIDGVGAYNRAWTFARRLVEVSWRINEMLFPTLVERRARGDHAGFDRALLDTLRYAAAGLLLPAAAGGGAAVGVMAVFGRGFGSAADAMAVLLVMPALATMSNLQRHALYAVGKPVQGSLSAVGRMVTTVGLGIGLTLWIGVTGTALAIVAGYAADLTYMYALTRGHLSRPARELVGVRQVVAIGLAYAAGFAVSRTLDITLGGVPGTLCALVCGTIVYAAVFVIAGGLTPRDRVRAIQLRALAEQRLRDRRRRKPAGDESTAAPATLI